MKFFKNLYHNNPEIVLLLAGAVLFLANLDALFVNIMEARNFITAREMLEQDNWIFTTMNEEPRYQKPPLPTWLTAISGSLFGRDSSFAFRLPAGLASIFLMWMFYKILLQFQMRRSFAVGAGIILITSFYIFFAGREGQWDIFTHSFMMGSIYFLLLLFKNKDKQYSNALAAGLFLGASIMSKGPVSIYALFLPFLLSYGIVFNFSSIFRHWKPLLLFLLTGLVTGTWWTIIVTYYDPAEFTRIAEVESDRWFNYNIRPFYYYWSFFTQSGIWTIPALAGLIYWYIKPRVSNLKVYKFYLFWTLISVLLLSIIPEKKSRYLLPVLIPLAATTAFYIEYVLKNYRNRLSQKEKLPLYLNFGILTLICFAAPVTLYFQASETVMEMRLLFFLFSLMLVLWGAALLLGMLRKKPKLLFSLQAGLMILIISLGFPLLKLIHPERNSPNVADLRSLAEEQELQVYDYNNMMPELVWYYGEAVPLHQKGSIPPEEEFILLIEEPTYPEWREDFPGYEAQYLEQLDLNPTYAKGSNNRLIRNYYLLRRLEP